MDLKGYNLKNTTKCECGYEFDIHDMKNLQRLSEPLYGGSVKHVDEIKCPKCNKDTLLLIKQQGQTYLIKDIGQKDKQKYTDNKIKNTIENNTKNTLNKQLNNTSNEIICPVCQRVFKNKSGLSRHMLIHN